MRRKTRAFPRAFCTFSSCRRLRGVACQNLRKKKRFNREYAPTRSGQAPNADSQRERRSFVGEGFDAGEFASAEKFEGGATAGGDVRNFAGDAGLVDSGDGITAADDGGGAASGGRGNGFGYFESALRKSGHFEDAHGAVPDDSLGGGNFLAIGVDGFGADVQA